MPSRELPSGPVPIATGVAELVRPAGDPTGVTLYVNGAESSHLDLADPARLEFEYMQQMAVVLEHVHGPTHAVRALHLGGGACAFARALDATRPGSRQLAVELDPVLATLVRGWFDLPRAPRLRIRVDDARDAVAAQRPGAHDVVIRDVFAGRQVPGHLRTAEFAALVARALAPSGGCYLANCADTPPLIGSRREVATLETVFPHVAVIAEPGILKGRRYGNLVLVGSWEPLPAAALARDLLALAFPVTLLAGDEARRFAGAARPFRDADPPDS